MSAPLPNMLRSFLLLAGLFLAASVRAEVTLTVGVVPQFPLEQIATAWTPVLREVAKASGVRLELKPYATIPAFETGFLKGEPDIVYLNPYHVVMANRAAGYIPIIRDDKLRLSGILVVRKDSSITSLAQLDGSTIAFPAPNAFGASLYIRALLTEQARIRFTPEYRTTHSNVFRHVISGRAQAGGAVRRTFASEPPEIQEQLRILYETPETFPHPIAIHPRIPAKVRETLQQAFLSLAARPDAAAMLSGIQIFVPARAEYSEYAPLGKLGLERYVSHKND